MQVLLIRLNQCIEYIFISADCVWDKWSPWTDCDSVCGQGTQSQVREIKWRPFRDGQECLIADRTRSEMCWANTNCTTQTSTIRTTTIPYSWR